MSNSSPIPSPSPSTVANWGAIEPSSHELALTIARAADDRKGADISILKVGGVSYLADYFVIVTGFSKVQVRAISQNIQEQVEEECHRPCNRVEGQADGTWVLLDYGDTIAHIMMPEERDYYNLEAFWGHAERVEFSASTPEARS
ncbi:MAG TPA: ribosome silencing factor [Oscillatoriales cyanobacterium M59_W2019_021]|nr:ribosome silencing factor [Oscillatoriales cyanobacterium M4454_W2019_049]HIK51636.1 ribosome silencing factor [Oscillatoriales cyanobacterium M59_W2019_021]